MGVLLKSGPFVASISLAGITGSGVVSSCTSEIMDPAQLIVPVVGIAAAAAITFYSVSFMQLSEKSFEKLEGIDFDKPQLRSSLSAKDKRKLRKVAKDQKNDRNPQ